MFLDFLDDFRRFALIELVRDSNGYTARAVARKETRGRGLTLLSSINNRGHWHALST